jgi:hypothetical protein
VRFVDEAGRGEVAGVEHVIEVVVLRGEDNDGREGRGPRELVAPHPIPRENAAHARGRGHTCMMTRHSAFRAAA